MTVTEMIKRIDEQCMENFSCDWCPLNPKSCKIYHTDNDVKNTYELMFGKEESKMENEFKIEDIKAGYLIEFEDGDLALGIELKKDELVFVNKNFDAVVEKDGLIKHFYKENCNGSYAPVKVYGYSDNFNLFDPSTRPLLWKKEEDMNFKIYKIGNLEIKPNYEDKTFACDISGYKTENEDFLFIENINENDEYITIRKSELDAIINVLTEIRDFIKGDE